VDFVTIEIVARPASQRRGVLGVGARGLMIGIGAPAEKGKANEELIGAIADIAGTARSDISILRGAATCSKLIRIASAHPDVVADRIMEVANKK
jgi:uncharacterized protein (TIGR00251 family)